MVRCSDLFTGLNKQVTHTQEEEDVHAAIAPYRIMCGVLGSRGQGVGCGVWGVRCIF